MTDYTQAVGQLFQDWLQTAEANLNTEAAIVEAIQRIESDLEVANKYGDEPRQALLNNKLNHLEGQLENLRPEPDGEDDVDTPAE